MQEIERVYMRTLRNIYDTERQLVAMLAVMSSSVTEPRLAHALSAISRQSTMQVKRIEGLFAALYLEPRSDGSWAATALLREAWESIANSKEGGTMGCAAALLALKRYEITLYETLLRWSERYELDEAVPDIRRCIAEELVQASILSEIAYAGPEEHDLMLTGAERAALH